MGGWFGSNVVPVVSQRSSVVSPDILTAILTLMSSPNRCRKDHPSVHHHRLSTVAASGPGEKEAHPEYLL